MRPVRRAGLSVGHWGNWVCSVKIPAGTGPIPADPGDKWYDRQEGTGLNNATSISIRTQPVCPSQELGTREEEGQGKYGSKGRA